MPRWAAVRRSGLHVKSPRSCYSLRSFTRSNHQLLAAHRNPGSLPCANMQSFFLIYRVVSSPCRCASNRPHAASPQCTKLALVCASHAERKREGVVVYSSVGGRYHRLWVECHICGVSLRAGGLCSRSLTAAATRQLLLPEPRQQSARICRHCTTGNKPARSPLQRNLFPTSPSAFGERSEKHTAIGEGLRL